MNGFIFDKERLKLIESIDEEYIKKDLRIAGLITKHYLQYVIKKDGEDLRMRVGKYHIGITHIEE